ncbi:nucleoside-diphosphate kinase [Candidatus Gracilibacteria bacterium]|jgi:nucleoside-diphosphate kinase|nr:nucleoside-diphosphate kinase [Candidatus Gracilibacteria bacterium]
MEKTLILLKPDTIQKSLIGTILARFEAKGYKVIGLKMMSMGDALVEEHYDFLMDKPFFPSIKSYMTSSPIVALSLEGVDVIRGVRNLCGATNPADAAPGTIRGDFAKNIDNNIIHSSDSVETAEKEIARFFKADEIFDYSRPLLG